MQTTPNKDWLPTDKECVTFETDRWRFGLIFGPECVDCTFTHGNLVERFSRMTPGSQSPSADRTHFLHNGLRYVGFDGSGSQTGRRTATAYELVELLPGMHVPQRRKFCYNGWTVRIGGKVHLLCRPVIFASRIPTLAEQCWTLRQMWAWDGHFAHQHKTYASFLQQEIHDYSPGSIYQELNPQTAPVIVIAAKAELKLCSLRKLPSTDREAMKALTRTDPLFVARPWAKPKVQPEPKPVFRGLSADDCLNALLASLAR